MRIDKLFKGGFSYTPASAELAGHWISFSSALGCIQVIYFTEGYELELSRCGTFMLNNKLRQFYVAAGLQTSVQSMTPVMQRSIPSCADQLVWPV